MYADKEINALSQTYENLKGLDHEAVNRIIKWVSDKFGLFQQESQALKPLAREYQTYKSPEITKPPVEQAKSVEIPLESIKRERSRKSQTSSGIVQKFPEKKERIPKSFSDYRSLKELLSNASIKKNNEKILLTAAFLQENKRLKELTSNDISSDLKKLRMSIKNPSQIINSLLNKKIPWLTLVGERGPSKQSRKRFRVTEEGLDIAKSYIE